MDLQDLRRYQWKYIFLKDEDLVQFIDDIYNNDENIKKSIIIQSFLFCGTSWLLDGSKDDLFG